MLISKKKKRRYIMILFPLFTMLLLGFAGAAGAEPTFQTNKTIGAYGVVKYTEYPYLDRVNPSASNAPAWFINAKWNLRLFGGETGFPDDDGLILTNEEIDFIASLKPPFVVVGVHWSKGANGQWLTDTEIARVQRLKNKGIKVIGYTAPYCAYNFNTDTWNKEKWFEQIEWIAENFDGVWEDGYAYLAWGAKEWYGEDPFFNEADVKAIHTLIKSKGSEKVWIASGCAWVLWNKIGGKVNNGEWWAIEYIDGLDWEMYGFNYLYTVEGVPIDHPSHQPLNAYPYNKAWNFIKKIYEHPKHPRLICGFSFSDDVKALVPNWNDRVPDLFSKWIYQGFSVFFGDIGGERGTDDGLSRNWRSWLEEHYPP